MRLVYLDGPYRGRTEKETAGNIAAAVDAAIPLVEAGIGVVVPHLLSAGLERHADEQYWLDLTMELMLRCDALYDYAPDRPSAGRDAEVSTAHAVFIPVFGDTADVIRWCKDAE